VVASLEEFVFQEGRKVGVVGEELPEGEGGFRAAVAFEEADAPVFREENVAGALDFREFLEDRKDVGDGVLFAQRVVEIGQRSRGPGFDRTVFRQQE
jgi:hypothetical protein